MGTDPGTVVGFSPGGTTGICEFTVPAFGPAWLALVLLEFALEQAADKTAAAARHPTNKTLFLTIDYPPNKFLTSKKMASL